MRIIVEMRGMMVVMIDSDVSYGDKQIEMRGMMVLMIGEEISNRNR